MKDINYAYDGKDDPDFPRRVTHDTREFDYFSEQDRNSTPTMKFIFKKWSALKEEFPLLDPAKVHVDSYHSGDYYDGGCVTFSFDRPQTDQEYAKALYYHKQSEARKAKRAAERALTAEQKISAKEDKERAEYERLKKKFSGKTDLKNMSFANPSGNPISLKAYTIAEVKAKLPGVEKQGGNDGKTQHEWHFKYKDTPATIYDWKGDRWHAKGPRWVFEELGFEVV